MIKNRLESPKNQGPKTSCLNLTNTEPVRVKSVSDGTCSR